MSDAAWVAARGAGVPPALADRVRSAAAQSNDLVNAAAETLNHVLHAEKMTRSQALDLLTADALATYAFERAAEQPASLVTLANDAMRQFGALGAKP